MVHPLLKPCPFCKCADTLKMKGAGPCSGTVTYDAWVECSGCGAEGPIVVSREGPAEGKAAEMWNEALRPEDIKPCPYGHVVCYTHSKPTLVEPRPDGGGVKYLGCEECLATERLEALIGEKLDDDDS